uniref:Uncharacterized protein n=1 Tax=Arundo donax TaxID=35708 RepID=A0A0A9AX31_ARUDO
MTNFDNMDPKTPEKLDPLTLPRN